MTWVPVVDVSEHQGSIDFTVMRNRGIDGLIIRSTHGQTRDARLGFNALHGRHAFADVGYYEFCNPKRGTPEACAEAFVHHVASVDDLDRTFLMLDIEAYVNEPPNRGTVWPKEQYAEWLWAHLARLRQLVDCPIIGYANNSYWQHGVDDRRLAAELDWIVARYPAYSVAAYANHPLPDDPDQWDQWAFARQANGPTIPVGADDWAGWQFSAGFNRQGSFYGCASDDLDLNIVRSEAWNRWTSTSQPNQPQTPDPPVVVRPPSSGEDAMQFTYNGITFAYDGFNLRWVRSGHTDDLLSPTLAPQSRETMSDLLVEVSHVHGPSPFGGIPGDQYRDGELDGQWQHRLAPDAVEVRLPTAISGVINGPVRWE